MTKMSSNALGLVLVALIAAIAQGLGQFFPLLGSILFAVLLGMAIRNTVGVHHAFVPGLTLTLKKLLKLAIILLGASLSLGQVLAIGQQALLAIVLAVLGGICLTVLFARILGVNSNLGLLIGVGTGICGATAISCAKGVVHSSDEETAYAISTIVFFNLIAFLLYPLIGHLLELNPLAFGIWAGTAVHDTSSAVAVGYQYGDVAGKVATTVKLTRTLFLVPVLVFIPFLTRGGTRVTSQTLQTAFPWFVLWFLLLAGINSIGMMSVPLQLAFTSVAKFLILMVMAAVGLQVKGREFLHLGFKPLITGLFASALVSVISLAVIHFTS